MNIAKTKIEQDSQSCGCFGHENQECHFLDAKCPKCVKSGHIASACHSSSNKTFSINTLRILQKVKLSGLTLDNHRVNNNQNTRLSCFYIL